MKNGPYVSEEIYGIIATW